MGCIRLPTGLKWCKSEEVKDKLTPTRTSFWSVKASKMLQEFGCNVEITPEILKHFSSLDMPKNVRKSGGLTYPVPPHSYNFSPRWNPNAAQRCTSFELHFP